MINTDNSFAPYQEIESSPFQPMARPSQLAIKPKPCPMLGWAGSSLASAIVVIVGAAIIGSIPVAGQVCLAVGAIWLGVSFWMGGYTAWSEGQKEVPIEGKREYPGEVEMVPLQGGSCITNSLPFALPLPLPNKVPPLSLPVECLGIEDGVPTDRTQKPKIDSWFFRPYSGLELVKFQPRWKEPPQKLLEGGGSVLIEMITPRRHLDWEFRQLRLTEGRAMTLARALFKAVGDGQEEDALSMLKRIDGELPKSGGSLIKEAAWRGADPKMREGIEKNYVNSAFNCRRVSS